MVHTTWVINPVLPAMVCLARPYCPPGSFLPHDMIRTPPVSSLFYTKNDANYRNTKKTQTIVIVSNM
jgi:hypothetical protein